MTSIIGKTLLNQFKVESFIASGGMGAVYRVWDLQRSVPLAMKILHAEFSEDAHILKRFEREARALKKLAHPNIVPFYGLYTSDDIVFILEKFIDGPSLAEILKQQKGLPLPIDDALNYLQALSAALGYAHSNGVIHCDVKPGNVMIAAGGSIYLTDFGIARHAESTNTTMGAAGTPAYMAPEQIREDVVTSATDIYALGIILFEMLTGQRPFRGTELEAETKGQTTGERIRYAHLHLPPPDPRQVNPEIPEPVALALLKSLDKDPSKRFSSAQDLFLAVCQGMGIPEKVVTGRAGSRSRDNGIPDQSGRVLVEPVQPGTQVASIKNIWLYAGVGIMITLFLAWMIFGRSPLTTSPISAATESTQEIIPQEITNTTNQKPTDEPLISTTNTPAPTPSDTPVPSATPIQLSKNPKDGAYLVTIPAGEFVMGSDPGSDPFHSGAESPSHKILLPDYSIYLTEVTNAMFKICVDAKACPKPGKEVMRISQSYYGNTKFDNYPVIYVSWVSAQSYCKWAGGRLPSEAEWEKAARGDDGRLFPWGNNPPRDGQINLCDSMCADAPYRTSITDQYPAVAPVGVHPSGASPYGVLDMSGNVSEWVYDWFKPTYPSYDYENPKGPASGTRRVYRGGSWMNSAQELRTVVRGSLKPDTTLDTLGFRCVVAP